MVQRSPTASWLRSSPRSICSSSVHKSGIAAKNSRRTHESALVSRPNLDRLPSLGGRHRSSIRGARFDGLGTADGRATAPVAVAAYPTRSLSPSPARGRSPRTPGSSRRGGPRHGLGDIEPVLSPQPGCGVVTHAIGAPRRHAGRDSGALDRPAILLDFVPVGERSRRARGRPPREREHLRLIPAKPEREDRLGLGSEANLTRRLALGVLVLRGAEHP